MKGNVKIPHILLSCLTGFATSNERSSKKTQITNNVYKLWKKTTRRETKETGNPAALLNSSRMS